MQYHKLLSYLLLFFLISSILVVVSPTNLAGVTGSIGSDIRSDGSYLYMTMEDGVIPYWSYKRANHTLDANNSIEGKYCENITYEYSQSLLYGALNEKYTYDTPIKPSSWSCKIMFFEMTESYTILAIKNSFSTGFCNIHFYNDGTLKTITTSTYTFTNKWSYNSIYTVTFSNIDYDARLFDVTISNVTSSETKIDIPFINSLAAYNIVLFGVNGGTETSTRLFLDDWTVGTQSNIDSDSATNIESTNTSFNGELINDGSPLQNASQSNHSVKILYGNYSINPIVDYGEQYTINNDAYETSGYGEPYYIGQSFTIGNIGQNISFSLQNISLNISRFGNPGNTTVRIRAINITNAIPAPDLVNVSINGDALSTDPEWVTFSFINPIILEKGTKYAIILNCTSAPPDYQNVIRWQCDMAGPASTYTGGNRMSGFNLSGEVDVTPSYWADDDYMFKLYGAYQYPFNSTFTELLSANTTNTDTFSKTIDGLTPGQIYYYRTYINTSYTNSSSYSYGDETYFLTKPEAPTSTSFTFINSTAINLSWTKGTGANRTIIVSGSTGMPSSVTDGTIIYNGTSSYYVKTITAGTSYYLRSWSYSNWTDPNLYQFSDNHTDFDIGGLYINCYDEINLSNLTFDVSIVNEDGSDVYTNWSCINTHTINVSLCPQGLVSIQISSNNHITRVYYLTIQENIFYVLNTYLAINQTEKTALYYLRIVETRETSGYAQDYGVENVLITIKRYINTTGIYETISSLYSDANGYINLYLIYDPSTDYKVFTNKSGYNDTISSYTPMPPNVYGQTTEKWFRITKTLIEQPTPPTTLTFKEVCNINGTWITINNTLLIVFIDYMGETNDIQFYIYEIYETNKTLKNTSNIYNGNISLYIADLNNSRTHEITLFLNHTTLGYIKDYSFFVYGIKNATLSESWIEDQLIDAFGNFDMGYVKMFIIWGPGMLILLALAGANHPGIGIIGSACWIVLLSWKLNAISVDTDTALIILFGLLLILGFIRLITKRRPDETGEG